MTLTRLDTASRNFCTCAVIQRMRRRTGAEGIDVLREHPDTCVVMLNLTMPGTSGFWFREQQLMEPALAHVPVIVFTGSVHAEQLHRSQWPTCS
jgi:CheY-like chemotaxis protein